MTEQQLLLPRNNGAFLVEEWSIDPLSTLPSYLEMKLIEDAARSGRQALKSFYELVVERWHIQVTRPLLLEDRIPRLRRIMAVAVRYLRNYSAEIRFIMLVLIERKFLQLSGASSAESVYGTKRSCVLGREKRLLPLNPVSAQWLAVGLGLVPYVKEKVDLWLRGEPALGLDPLTLSPSRLGTLELILKLLVAGSKAGNAVMQWRFLMGQSVHFDLISFILQLVVQRKTQQDYAKPSSSTPIKSPEKNTNPSPLAAASVAPEQERLERWKGAAFTVGLAVLTFSWLTQLLGAWTEEEQHQASQQQSENEAGQCTREAGASPPHLHFPVSRAAKLHPDRCPKCRREWVEPTVSTRSFLVYCKECLEADADPLGALRMVRLFEPLSPTER